MQLYVDAFNLLTASRQVIQGAVGRIPYSEISKFCEDEDITGDMREELFYLIGEMDHFFVQWQNKFIKKKIDAETKAKPQQTPKTPRRR